MNRGAHRIVRIQHRLDGPAADFRPRDGGGDTFAGNIGQLLVHELGRISAPLADKVTVEPLFGQAFELPEEMELGLFARIAPLRVEQPLRQVKQQRRGPQVSRVSQIEIDPLADDALIPRNGWSHDVGGEFQH